MIAKTFIHELLRDGVALTSGIGSVLFGLLAASISRPLPNKSFWAVAFMCFVYSCYRVWKAKHRELVAAQAKITELESVDQQLERRRHRAELEKLEEENRAVAERRAQEDLDTRLLVIINENLAEMRKQNEIHSNFQAYTAEFFAAAATQLGVTDHAVREAMQRLKTANKIPGLADLILVSPWGRL
jgi:hypothetical protein